MQYLLMLYGNEGSWSQMTPAEQAQGVAAYAAYTQALKTGGALVGSNRLQNSTTATTVHVADGKSQVLDGPYVDSKEQLAGYYLIEANDLDAAIGIAARIPSARDGSIEVRPIWVYN